MADVEELIRFLEANYPCATDWRGRLFSTVRRMKAEKQLAVPVNSRTGFVISAASGKAANEMDEGEWEQFYQALCGNLKRDYPDEHERLLP